MIYIDVDGVSFGIVAHLVQEGEIDDNPHPEVPTLMVEKLVIGEGKAAQLVPLSFAVLICKYYGNEIFGNCQPEVCEKLNNGDGMQVVLDPLDYGKEAAIH